MLIVVGNWNETRIATVFKMKILQFLFSFLDELTKFVFQSLNVSGFHLNEQRILFLWAEFIFIFIG